MASSSKNEPKSDSRFKPGNKAGKGRPVGSRNKASLAVDALLDGEAEGLTRKCIELAKDGDATALRLCMERIAPLRKGRPITLPLPSVKTAADVMEAIGITVATMAAGEISPDEAAVIAGVLEIKRRTIEMADHEQRILAIEAIAATADRSTKS